MIVWTERWSSMTRLSKGVPNALPGVWVVVTAWVDGWYMADMGGGGVYAIPGAAPFWALRKKMSHDWKERIQIVIYIFTFFLILI